MGAKLTFVYGTMSSGKTTRLLQTKHNYESNGHEVHIIKPSIDTKGDKKVVSRLGIEADVDLLINDDTLLYSHYAKLFFQKLSPKVILVDEAQFLSASLIDDLCGIVDDFGIDVICFGLKLNSESEPFKGSAILFARADILKEELSICACGRRATENLRYSQSYKRYLFNQSEICIDGEQDDIEYISMCRKCATKIKRDEMGF